MSDYDDALSPLAETGATPSAAPYLGSKISEFQNQNLSPQTIQDIANGIPMTVGGIPGIGSSIPGLGKIGIPGLDKVNKFIGKLSQYQIGTGGEWESLHYANDLNAHHPKFKFLFKVRFVGFTPDNPNTNFYYYVHRIDKPKVRLQHADVNFYNFRTRVLTHVTYDPLTVTFLDEIGDTVNQFFVKYMRDKSGQANGNWGIDNGMGAATSSKPYDTPPKKPKQQKGYADGKLIIVEQIFGNGSVANRFYFHNPRIESFDFDELNMDDNAGSALTCTFTYDALSCETNRITAETDQVTSWGKTDLLRSGGTSSGAGPGLSASGLGVSNGDSPISKDPGGAYIEQEQGVATTDLVLPSLADTKQVISVSETTIGGLGTSAEGLTGNASSAMDAASGNLLKSLPSLGEFNPPTSISDLTNRLRGVASGVDTDMMSRQFQDTYSKMASGANSLSKGLSNQLPPSVIITPDVFDSNTVGG